MVRVLGIFAHPDDETFFAGGTFAAYAARGADVRLVTLTAGEALGPGQVANYAAACRALGVAGWEFAAPGRWRDRGAARGTRSRRNHAAPAPPTREGGAERDHRHGGTDAPDSLAAAPLADVVTVVRDVLACYPSDIVVTADADGVTGNADHVAVHDAVLAAAPEAELWCACVRADDVRRATEQLQALVPDGRIGSGGVVGVPAGTDLLEVEIPLPARRSRATALDSYASGLGSRPLSELVADGTRVGDGVLLRAIVDVAGPERELFRAPG